MKNSFDLVKLTDRCDLHTHSTASDGTFTPSQIVEEAERKGLFAVGLCDHNTLSGLSEFKEAAENKSIIAVSGIEITCAYIGKDIHIVGLFIPESGFNKINEFLVSVNESKRQSNDLLAKNLVEAGYNIDYEKIKTDAGDGYVNRVPFAVELVEKGYIGSVKEAMNTILDEKAGYYVPSVRPDAFKVINLFKSVGAAPVLAHPFLNLSYDELLEFLPVAKESGLIAIETDYSKFSKEEKLLAKELAQRFSLLQSGGSDFHGDNKPDIALGEGRGDLFVPASFCKNIYKSLI